MFNFYEDLRFMKRTKIVAIKQDLKSLFIQLSDHRLLSIPKSQLGLNDKREVSTQDIFHVDGTGQIVFCESLNFRLSLEDILSPYDLSETVTKQFHFEDFKYIGNLEIQRILPEIDHKDLIQAILHQDSEILPHITANMSKRAAQLLRDDISYLNKLEHADHLASKLQIEKVVNRLIDAGKIELDKSRIIDRSSLLNETSISKKVKSKVKIKKTKFQINYVILFILAITFLIIFYTASEYFKLKKQIELSNKIKTIQTIDESY